MDHDLLWWVRDALAAGDDQRLCEQLQAMRPADLADVVERLDPVGRARVFGLLDDEAAGEVLHEVGEAVAAEVVRGLPPARASRILGEMPHDDAADVLLDLPDGAADALLAGMDAEEAEDVRELLEYPENSAGGRMVTDFATVSEKALVADVIAGLRAHPPPAETAYYLYVCDGHGRLAGVVSLRDLIVAPPDAVIGEVMTRDVIRVRADADQEEAADVVARYDLLAVPVVDARDRVIGVITVDDVIEVLEEEATEDILRLSSGAEAPPERASPSPRARAPGIGAAFVAGLAAAAVVGAYRGGLQRHLPLLLFLPLVLAISEVITGQVMAAVVGAMRRDLPRPGLWHLMAREATITAGLGALVGGLIAAVLGYWSRLGHVGSVVGPALFLVAITASLVAALLPVASRVLRQDPSAVPVSLAAAVSDTAAVAVYSWVLLAAR